jgi:hypothetical protein
MKVLLKILKMSLNNVNLYYKYLVNSSKSKMALRLFVISSISFIVLIVIMQLNFATKFYLTPFGATVDIICYYSIVVPFYLLILTFLFLIYYLIKFIAMLNKRKKM